MDKKYTVQKIRLVLRHKHIFYAQEKRVPTLFKYLSAGLRRGWRRWCKLLYESRRKSSNGLRGGKLLSRQRIMANGSGTGMAASVLDSKLG